MENRWWNYRTDKCLCSLWSYHLRRESCTIPWLEKENLLLASKWLKNCRLFVDYCTFENVNELCISALPQGDWVKVRNDCEGL